MSDKKIKRNDLSAFAGVQKPNVLNKASEKPVAKEKAIVSQKRIKKKAPWDIEGVDDKPKKTFLIRVSEADHAMMLYIKKKTGASASYQINEAAMPEIRKKAKSLFSNE